MQVIALSSHILQFKTQIRVLPNYMTNEVIKHHTKSPILEEHLVFLGCKASCRETAVIKVPLEFSQQ